MSSAGDRIEGRRPVLEALRAGRAIRRILVADRVQERGTIADIVRVARRAGVRVERLPRAAIERRARTSSHQGVIAEVARFRSRSWHEGVEAARAAGRAPLVLALDGIADPHNVGALLRSAEAFGVDAVLLPRRRAATIGPVVIKASSGAVEHLVIDEVGNLERALAACREDGLWIVALAAQDDPDIRSSELLGEPVAVVVGAEGDGVSKLILDRADARVGIPLRGNIESLNASVAGALCLWEAARRRRSGV